MSTYKIEYRSKGSFLAFLQPHLGAAALASTAGSGRTRLMVFVHGGHGDYVATWTNTNTKVYWPELVRDDATNFGSMDVAMFDYFTPRSLQADGVEKNASKLRDMLKESKAAGYDDIVFVAHSLGGVVTRQFLVDLEKDKDPLLGKIRLVMSMTCAYGGSWVPGVLSKLRSKNHQFDEVKPGSSFLTSLNARWDVLRQTLNPQQKQRPFVLAVWGESDDVVKCDNAVLGCDEVLRMSTPAESVVITREHAKDLSCHTLFVARTDKKEILFPKQLILAHPRSKIKDKLGHSDIVKPDNASHVSHLALREAFRLAVSDS